MERLRFIKMVAAGNDFIVLDNRKDILPVKGKELSSLVQRLCSRKWGVGADGVLILQNAPALDFKMRIFNPDGSEPAMCGNGARCIALYAFRQGIAKRHMRFLSGAGILQAEVTSAHTVRLKMSEPRGIRLGLGISLKGRRLRVNFINTGVPHTVVFVEGLKALDVDNLGRMIRYHRRFSPAGTNVDFMEIIKEGVIQVRTYERGVEGETLACGSGAVASAVITALSYPNMSPAGLMEVRTQGGDILKVHFRIKGKNIEGVWLEGPVILVYEGQWELKIP